MIDLYSYLEICVVNLLKPNRINTDSINYLRASLISEEVTSMLCLLWDFEDIFAWSQADMPGVLPELAKHRLSLRSGCRLVL